MKAHTCYISLKRLQVDINKFKLKVKKEDFFFTASRLVSYKKIEIIIRAFNQLPTKKLIIAGSGPDEKKLKKIAKNNIEFLGFIESSELKLYMQNAKAFVFASEEDFGIVPVEAQACGTPVIGLAKGGLLETVKHNYTGVLFENQTSQSILNALKYFETQYFEPEIIRASVEKFSKKRFEKEIKNFVELKSKDFLGIK